MTYDLEQLLKFFIFVGLLSASNKNVLCLHQFGSHLLNKPISIDSPVRIDILSDDLEVDLKKLYSYLGRPSISHLL